MAESNREALQRVVAHMSDEVVDQMLAYARAGGVLKPRFSPGPAMTDAELDSLSAVTENATPGPWFVRELDDSHAMNLTVVSTIEDERHLRWPDVDHNEIVAATLIQEPRYVDHAAHRWDEDAVFIATARTAMPRLIAEVRSLRAKYGARLAVKPIDSTTQLCRRCDQPVVAEWDRYEVFEGMHWLCFHLESEHGAFDPDEACGDSSCPWNQIKALRHCLRGEA